MLQSKAAQDDVKAERDVYGEYNGGLIRLILPGIRSHSRLLCTGNERLGDVFKRFCGK